MRFVWNDCGTQVMKGRETEFMRNTSNEVTTTVMTVVVLHNKVLLFGVRPSSTLSSPAVSSYPFIERRGSGEGEPAEVRPTRPLTRQTVQSWLWR